MTPNRRFAWLWVAVLAGIPGLEGCSEEAKTGALLESIETPTGAMMPASTSESAAPGSPIEPGSGEPNTEAYDRIRENDFLRVDRAPLSTFSVDVDTASYANVRRFLDRSQLPPPDAVRIEELVNYFSYDDPAPEGEVPFSVAVEVADCPWAPGHRLARIGLKGRTVPEAERPGSNLVFLIDVSGSMRDPAKLPLVKAALNMLVDRLGENDRVAIVVYASAQGLALPSISCDQKEEIRSAIDQLEAGGSTNGGAGIQLAYETAVRNLVAGGINRVVLCTDGDFNVGITDRGALLRLIEEKAKSGVFLSVLGFGSGNLKDSSMEQVADHGNGNYAYIDSPREARKALVVEMGGTLITIAKDVKIQVEFNPARVAAYRLIGYENRLLRDRDFADDTKDAGEIGAGHSVTALYELIPPGSEDGPRSDSDPLKYQHPAADESSRDLFTVRLRYKAPDGDESRLIEQSIEDEGGGIAEASANLRFAAAVASFGMLLRDSPHKGQATYDRTIELAESARGSDPNRYRWEFVELVRAARTLANVR